MIYLLDVNCIGVNPNIVCLEDAVNRLVLSVHKPSAHQRSVEEQGLRNNDRVQVACALYDPKSPWLKLIGVKKILEIPTIDGRIDFVPGLNPALGFGY